MTMSTAQTTLYDILKSLIHGGEFDHKEEQDLIDAAKTRYLSEGPRGQIPNPVTDDFKAGLESELRDMLKTITYGHFDVRSYNLKRSRSQGPKK